jgi:hypothetical protein
MPDREYLPSARMARRLCGTGQGMPAPGNPPAKKQIVQTDESLQREMGDFQSSPREKQNVALLVSPLVAQLKKFREDFQDQPDLSGDRQPSCLLSGEVKR